MESCDDFYSLKIWPKLEIRVTNFSIIENKFLKVMSLLLIEEVQAVNYLMEPLLPLRIILFKLTNCLLKSLSA